MDKLGILRPTVICKATEHVREQLALIEKLLAKGVAYDTPEAVYFDVTKFSGYGSLFGQKLEEKMSRSAQMSKPGNRRSIPRILYCGSNALAGLPIT